MIGAVGDDDPRIATLPLASSLIAFTGGPASGKTAALVRRYVALVGAGGLAPERTVVAAASAASARALAGRIAARLDAASRDAFAAAPFAGVTLDAVAFAIVADGAVGGGLAADIERLESYETEEIFARSAAPLFSADWEAFLGPDIDPEISGLRAPDRFASAVLRLIVKLRDAGIGPDAFLAKAQRGAARFYAAPPNLAEPGLLFATKDEYRASLTVGRDELEHQRRRELDLAKIVAKLYHAYLDELVRVGCLGAGDAIAEAVRLIDEQPGLARAYRERLRLAVVDDAHDLRSGELRLLQALFGRELCGVAIAGAPETATQAFDGARPDATFRLAATTIVLAGGGPPAQIAAVARAIIASDAERAVPQGDAVRVHRAGDRAAEIAFVAASVAARVAAGTPPERVAVLHRSARTLGAFEDALVARDIPVAPHGDVDLLARPEVADALAVLWVAADPFRHDHLLRVLQMPLVHLSDASAAVLCGEPADPQALLFPLPAEEPDGERRWDRRRDLRLASNVLGGHRDLDLTPLARERIRAFRARQERWALHARAAGIYAAPGIVSDAGLRAAQPGEPAARTARRNALIDALLGLIERYARRRPGSTLDEALAMLERVAGAERGPAISGPECGVFVGAIDRIGPRRFAHVFAVDVRAGSFPPYYVPDAFLFSANWGMIPKDAVGDASASRTAKFTWYQHHAKLRDTYADQHRRLLAYALTRADETATVSAGGRATRGLAAPELAAELARMRPRVADAPLPE